MPGWDGPLLRSGDYRWIIPRTYQQGMLVDGLIFAAEDMIETLRSDSAPQQVANGAHLPGIVGWSMAMPDIHWGYGLPIGGVVATQVSEGVISPGGVGFDGNCGVRLITIPLERKDVENWAGELADRLEAAVPTGVGRGGKIRLSLDELRGVLTGGARWAIERGYGPARDLEVTEENGAMAGADPGAVSDRAKKRGLQQLGTLGSGNHFIEIGYVERVIEPSIARVFGLSRGQVTVLIHSGSRGLGHQVCTDYVAACDRVTKDMGFVLPDRQLASAPLSSSTGRDYLAALAAAANYAWANRQCLTGLVRKVLGEVLGLGPEEMPMVFDQAHNIARIEDHNVNGREQSLCVHRKGACRALPPGHDLLAREYRESGQPVLVPGDMGTASYVMAGLPGARDSFFSACHGAGRALSRGEARRRVKGADLRRDLAGEGILVRGIRDAGLAEEAPVAYKDIDRVVEVTERAGLAGRVARLRPMIVLKG